MNSQSILPASCTSSCLMLMICSSRARNRSPDPVVSCFFGRIAPSDAATESCFSIRGNREELAELFAHVVCGSERLPSNRDLERYAPRGVGVVLVANLASRILRRSSYQFITV